MSSVIDSAQEERLTRSCRVTSPNHRERVAPSFSRLQEVADFGTNPGALRMLTYLPDNLSPRPALVVVLHGSMQSAANYDLGAGWSTLADRYGFALLMPEQSRKNNLNRSFNWFQRNDTQRGEGEAHSIVQMVEQMVRDHDIDRRRIFVTGLSAGGAMTLAMLATYPDVFAAGAVIAGLPYGGATNAQEALHGMFQAPPKSSRELGDLVREASPNTTVWPKLSVWHGSADRTVKPSNASEIIKQWLDVHGLPLAPMSEQIVDGHPRQVWWNAEGETVIESYMITDMAHGTPLSRSEGGVAGPHMIEAGISSSDHIAKFFGLTDATFKAPAETTKLLRPVPLFGALRKATRSPRIRAVRAWRDAGDNIAKMLIAVGLMKASISDQS
jgi:poly(hydroxyalkanoate) depolymerase family esterase